MSLPNAVTKDSSSNDDLETPKYSGHWEDAARSTDHHRAEVAIK